MKKDCWWNESARSGKDTAFLETPMTPAANTTAEPPITGMWRRFDEEAVLDPPRFCSCDISVSTKLDSLGDKPTGPEVELRSAAGHQSTTTGTRRLACTHETVSMWREIFRLHPRILDCRGLSYQLARCATGATSSHSATLVERYSTNTLVTESSLNVLVVCIG